MSTELPEQAASALGELGVSIASNRSVAHARRGHRRIRLQGMTEGTLKSTVAALRADPRVSFVGEAYRPLNGGHVVLVDRLSVQFREDVVPGEVHQFAATRGMKVLREPPSGQISPVYWLSYPRGRDPLVVAAEVHHDPLVDWAVPDMLTEVRASGHVPTDPYYGSQYCLKSTLTRNGTHADINVEPAWTVTKGADVRIAVRPERSPHPAADRDGGGVHRGPGRKRDCVRPHRAGADLLLGGQLRR